MPYARKSRKSTKSSRYIKKRRLYRSKRSKIRRYLKKPTTAIARGPSGFPDRLFVKLNYVDTFTYAIAAGVAVETTFRGNSLYDPDKTNAGHQPLGHDQWSNFYGSYRVYGSKIQSQVFYMTSGSTAANYTTFMAVYPTLNDTISTYPYPLEEYPYCTVKNTNIYQQGNPQNKIKKYMSTAKIFGVKPISVKTEDDFTAIVTANPVNDFYWNVVCGTLDASSDATLKVWVKITYYAEYFARKNLPYS